MGLGRQYNKTGYFQRSERSEGFNGPAFGKGEGKRHTGIQGNQEWHVQAADGDEIER